ncbi:response regulator [Halalkalibacter alkalisediminis]|uniref:Response regulator n=1 Tax=Halalkalibacter alkalisediminis TaxID=935616 RepID=A0ABV6NK61_9BACI|nr:response regulator [Halalkalibacter alkalisediminis]
MSNRTYQVLVVEDDFRLAGINQEFIEELPYFKVVNVCMTGKETLQFLENSDKPDLIFLDMYIPDVKGLELLWTIRTLYKDIDIIMVTAAKEVETIQEAIRGGVFDYLVKPLEKNRVHYSLQRYQQKQSMFEEKKEFTQKEIDLLQTDLKSNTLNQIMAEGLPKGVNPHTLGKVKRLLEDHKETGLTALEGAEYLGASRSTTRRYFEYFISVGTAKAEMIYGDVGRPERRYFPL